MEVTLRGREAILEHLVKQENIKFTSKLEMREISFAGLSPTLPLFFSPDFSLFSPPVFFRQISRGVLILVLGFSFGVWCVREPDPTVKGDDVCFGQVQAYAP